MPKSIGIIVQCHRRFGPEVPEIGGFPTFGVPSKGVEGISYIGFRVWGFRASQNSAYFFGVPYNKDSSMLG